MRMKEREREKINGYRQRATEIMRMKEREREKINGYRQRGQR